jgi:uncharacterized protein YyaL (SSP411 family)
VQVVVIGEDAIADELEAAATVGYAVNKSVIRLTRSQVGDSLPPMLAETLPHLAVDQSIAVVCKGTTCLPPTSVPERLLELLS